MFFSNSLLYFLSLSVLFMSIFKAKWRAFICILVFCFMTTSVCRFLVIVRYFSNADPLFILTTSFIKFQSFSDPLFIRNPPRLFGT